MYGGGELDISLVLCNKRNEVRVIRVYNVANMGFNLPQMRYRNIIDIYETYCFNGQLFIVSEYLDFSLEDLLRHDIYLTETEIACVIRQVREMPHLYQIIS
jgi:serine/threonine protein kinase